MGQSSISKSMSDIAGGLIGKVTSMVSKTETDIELAKEVVYKQQLKVSKAQLDRATRLPELLESLQICDMKRVDKLKYILNGVANNERDYLKHILPKVESFSNSVKYIDSSCGKIGLHLYHCER